MTKTPDYTLANECLDIMGVPKSSSNVEHFMVLWEAMLVYDQRNALYEDNWRTFGWKDSLHHCRSKVSRLFAKFGNDAPDKDLDDAVDLINYAAFFVRNVRAGNENGVET